MRRVIAGAVAGVLAFAAFALFSPSDGDFEVAAVFDSANGIIPGQQVKISGAVVGSIESVELAEGPKARVLMRVDERFGPFRSDATCTILPEGLISENFVECEPGTGAEGLATGSDGVPTVALEQTTVPFSLQDILNVFSVPTPDRLQLLISELGIGLSAQGENLNALIRRANPALQRSRRVLQILGDHRERLATAVGQTDRVLASLGRRDAQIRRFVARAAKVSETTAERRTALGQSVERLPAMLRELRPGLASLDRTAESATPLLRDVRGSAPELGGFVRNLRRFMRGATPALEDLGEAAAAGRPAVESLLPVTRRLRRLSGPLIPTADEVERLLTVSRDNGTFEGIGRAAYGFAQNTGTFDEQSHYFTSWLVPASGCIDGDNRGEDVRGCQRRYYHPGKGTIPINQPSCGPTLGLWYEDRCEEPAPGSSGLPTPIDPTFGSTTRSAARLGKVAAKAARARGGGRNPGAGGGGRLDGLQNPGRPQPRGQAGAGRGANAPELDTSGLKALMDYLVK